MNCLRSFNFKSDAFENLVAPDIDVWLNGVHTFWIAQKPAGISTFNIQGFKNINIHSIEVQGIVDSNVGTANSVIVNDWTFAIQVNGQNALVSGLTVGAPNPYAIVIQGTNVNFNLSKYSPKFTLMDPIQSARSIQILGLKASGIGVENIAAINLSWTVNFIVYYSYEGD